MLKLILVKKNITMISLLFKEILKWVNSHVTLYIRGGEPIVRWSNFNGTQKIFKVLIRKIWHLTQ